MVASPAPSDPMTYDVIIVGGGAMGASTAYHLLRSDTSLSVAVLERDKTYRRASTILSDGNVRIQFNLDENIRISQYTMEVLETFDADMATDGNRPEVGAKHQGNLFLVDEGSRTEALAGVERQQALGCDVVWMDADAVASTFPRFAGDGYVGGTFGRRDGSVDPHAVLWGYRRKAIEMGARFVEVEALALLAEGGAIRGVRTADGDLRSDHVVNTAGAWAADLAATIRVSLPVVPVMRTVYVVATRVETAGMPSVFLPSGLYVIPERDATWIVAWSAPDDPVGYDFTPSSTERFESVIWPELVANLPAFDSLRVQSAWAGLYAVNTLDGNAILGQWPTIRGFYVAAGFSGHGFQQCPAVGRYLSEVILGLPHALDLSRLGTERIIAGEPLREHAGRII